MEKPGEARGEKQSGNFTKSGHFSISKRSDLCAGAVSRGSEIGATGWGGDAGHPPVWPSYRGGWRGQAEPRPLDALHSLSPGFSDKWGSGHERRGKVASLRPCDMAAPEYWLRSRGAGLIDGWSLLVMDVQQLFTTATLAT